MPLNYRNARFNDCWGFSYEGEEYGVLGSTLGGHVIWIKEDNTAEEVGLVPGSLQGFLANHRDFKTFGHYLYLVEDEQPATFQIADFSYLPDSIHVVYNSNEKFSNCHDLFIDEDAGILYACGTSSSALSLYDLNTTPEDPELIINFTSLPYVHDCFVRDGVAYLNGGFDGLMVVDFSDPATPIILSTITEYLEQGYCHSGWLNADGTKYVMADETPGMDLKLFDVSDLTEIELTDTFNTQPSEVIYPHNPMIRSELIFVSYYIEGLQIFDFSDPSEVERVAYYDTSPVANVDSVAHYGAWGVYPFLPSGRILLSDRQEGLFVFGIDDYDLSVNDTEVGLSSYFTIYPNPGKGSLLIASSKARINRIDVYNAQGKWIKNLTTTQLKGKGNGSVSLQLPNVERGLYFIRISSSEGVETKRYELR
ncbi:MAG: choice-of-anchor B domain-containing protein [Flavobacteriales bacterium]